MWKLCTVICESAQTPSSWLGGYNAGPSIKDITHSSNQRRCRASRSSVIVDDTKSQSIHHECNSVNGLDLVEVLNQFLNHYRALNPLLLPINKQSVHEPIDIEHSGLFENNQDTSLPPCVNFSGDGTQRRARIWTRSGIKSSTFVIYHQLYFYFSSKILAKSSYPVNPRLNKVYVCMYVMEYWLYFAYNFLFSDFCMYRVPWCNG